MRLFPSKNSKLILVSAFVCGAFGSFSQTLADLSAYKAKYPGQHIVQKKNSYRITIKMVKDVPVVSHQSHREYLVLDRNGVLSLSQETIDFSSFEIMGAIDAYSLMPTEKSSKKIPATNFATKDAETSGSVFFDDSKETSFIYPNLVEGSLRVLDYQTQMTDFSFPFGFNFYSSIPMESAEFVIECDTAVHLLTKLFNDKRTPIEFSERLEKNKRILTWTLKTGIVVKDDELAPSPRYYSPHLLSQIDYYTTKKGRINVTGTPEDLHNLYKNNLAEVVNEQPSAELKMIADSITSGLTDEQEKVKAIYYWVQDNIKYIAFEEGINGFVPRQPSNVMRKRYGDCKDMASLIYSMLKAENIPVYLTWIGSRDLPYKYTEFPSSFCDNHMISVYKNPAGAIYFLDATNSFQSWNYPTGFIQGKEAMMHISPTEFEIINVPVPDASRTSMTDTAYISIDGKSLIGKSRTVIDGYYHSILGGYLQDVPEKEMDKALQSVNEKGNNSFEIRNSKVEYLRNREVPMVMSYDFRVSNYVTSYDNEVYVNMVLEKDISRAGEMKAGRTSPFELDNKSSDSYTVILKVPEGYKVKSVPKNASYTSDFLNYDLQYKQEKDRVTMTLKLKIDFLMLYPEQFPQWNDFIKVKKSSISEAVVLIKN